MPAPDICGLLPDLGRLHPGKCFDNIQRLHKVHKPSDHPLSSSFCCIYINIDTIDFAITSIREYKHIGKRSVLIQIAVPFCVLARIEIVNTGNLRHNLTCLLYTSGISSLVGTVLDGFNTYVAPVLQELANQFSTMWSEHVQPALSKFVELFGKLADAVKTVWDESLQPFLQWCAQKFAPTLAPIIKKIGTLFIDVLGVIADTVSDIIDAIGRCV